MKSSRATPSSKFCGGVDFSRKPVFGVLCDDGVVGYERTLTSSRFIVCSWDDTEFVDCQVVGK